MVSWGIGRSSMDLLLCSFPLSQRRPISFVDLLLVCFGADKFSGSVWLESVDAGGASKVALGDTRLSGSR